MLGLILLGICKELFKMLAKRMLLLIGFLFLRLLSCRFSFRLNWMLIFFLLWSMRNGLRLKKCLLDKEAVEANKARLLSQKVFFQVF